MSSASLASRLQKLIRGHGAPWVMACVVCILGTSIGLVVAASPLHPVIVGLGALGLVAIAIAIRKPVESAFALLWAVRLEPAPVDVLLPLGALVELLRGRLTVRLTPAVGLILSFVLLNSLQMLLLPDSSIRFGAITIYLGLSTIALVGMRSLPRLEYLYHLSARITALQLILFGFPYYLGVLPTWLTPWVTESGRVSAFFKDPNVAAPFVISSMLFYLDRFLVGQGKKNLVWSAFLLLGATMTFSRGAFLSACISVLVLLAVRYPRYQGRVIRLSLGGSVAIAAVAPLLIPLMINAGQSRFLTIFNSYDLHRLGAWVGGLRAGLVHPFGTGPGTFSSVVADYHPLGIGMAAHNTYVHVFVENGVVGLALLAALLGVVVWQSWRSRESRAWIFSALVGILVESLVIDTLHWRHFWILVALALHAHPMTEQADANGQALEPDRSVPGLQTCEITLR